MDKLTIKELERAFKVLNEYDPDNLSEGWGLSFVVFGDTTQYKEVTAEIQNGQWVVLNNVELNNET